MASRISSLITKEYSFTVLYTPVARKGYQVTVPLLPGLVTFGRTFDEAREMAREAVACHVEALQKDHESVPTEKSLLQERLTVMV